MTVRVVLLVLGDVEALQPHVLLCTARGRLDARRPAPRALVSAVRLGALEPASLCPKDLQQHLCDAEEGVGSLLDRVANDLVAQAEADDLDIGEEALDASVAAAEVCHDRVGLGLDLAPQVLPPVERLRRGVGRGLGSWLSVHNALREDSNRHARAICHLLEQPSGNLSGGRFQTE